MKCWRVAVSLLTLTVLCDSFKIKNWIKKLKQDGSQNGGNIPEAQWFQQPLDHFNKTNKNTFKQRYFVINEYYKKGGPAFLVQTGEWTDSPTSIRDYAAVEYAKKLNAIVFSLEHRYYGESRPTSDLSTENLRFLTIEQALEDTASFITAMNTEHKLPQGIRWIDFGCSYAANIVTWMRYKYRHLVYASVAYSAPVQGKLDFYEYNCHVIDVIRAFDEDCLEALKRGHAQLKEALKNSDLLQLSKKLKLCVPIDQSNMKDVQSLYETFEDILDSIVQFKQFEDMKLKDVCDVMTNKSGGDFLDRYAKVATLAMEMKSKECLDYQYKNIIDNAKNISWDNTDNLYGVPFRQWTYQTCTEVGNFQPSCKTSKSSSNDIPLEYFTQQCVDIFGPQFNEKNIQRGVDKTNKLYGGKDLNVTRVAFVNGDEDPWMELGITKTKVPESPAILVKGQSHCACSSILDNKASEEYRAACKQVEDLVTKWSTEKHSD